MQSGMVEERMHRTLKMAILAGVAATPLLFAHTQPPRPSLQTAMTS